jgi:hypothetical protein
MKLLLEMICYRDNKLFKYISPVPETIVRYSARRALAHRASYKTRLVLQEALAVFRPTACKTAIFRGCFFKTEVLKKPLQSIEVVPTGY